jgi:hypothetical protein
MYTTRLSQVEIEAKSICDRWEEPVLWESACVRGGERERESDEPVLAMGMNCCLWLFADEE